RRPRRVRPGRAPARRDARGRVCGRHRGPGRDPLEPGRGDGGRSMIHAPWKLIRRQPRARRGRIAWEDLGPTPLGENGYTPQGMTWVDGRIVFANSWKDTRSRVYRYAPERMELEATFDMPPEAVHTSGLAWDGTRFFAVDYKSNRCYEIDLA